MTGREIGDGEVAALSEILKEDTTFTSLKLKSEKERKKKEQSRRENDRQWDWR